MSTDLEMTKLCAEAMGLEPEDYLDKDTGFVYVITRGSWLYQPLHDDAQAMALVKRFEIGIDRTDDCIAAAMRCGRKAVIATSTDLNRAIVECVAKMQAAKT